MPNTLQSLIDQISSNPNVRDFVKDVQNKAHKALKAVTDAQKQIDREIDQAIARVRKSADEMERNLEYYRKQALAQKARLEKAIRQKAKTAKAGARKAKRKTSKKARKTKKK